MRRLVHQRSWNRLDESEQRSQLICSGEILKWLLNEMIVKPPYESSSYYIIVYYTILYVHMCIYIYIYIYMCVYMQSLTICVYICIYIYIWSDFCKPPGRSKRRLTFRSAWPASGRKVDGASITVCMCLYI